MVSDGNRLGHPGNPEAPDHTATRARGIGSPGRQAVILAIVFLSLLAAAIGTTGEVLHQGGIFRAGFTVDH